MKYNDAITAEYGGSSGKLTGISPTTNKPHPKDSDYNNGYFTRVFIKKVNENILMEIRPEDAKSINAILYKIVYLNWRITGIKDTVRSSSMVNIIGVSQQNLFEIDRIKKEQELDLSRLLQNPLEYWRGY